MNGGVWTSCRFVIFNLNLSVLVLARSSRGYFIKKELLSVQ